MEDVRPWATIKAVAPMQLQGVWMRMATITSAMWLTEEYVMSDFRSIWRRQIELVMIMPHKDSMMNGYAI